MKLSMFRSASSPFGAFGSVALLAIVVLVTSPVVSSKTYPMSDADNDWLNPAPYTIRSKRMADNLQLDQDLDKDDSMKLVSKRLARDVAQLVALKKASRLVKRNLGKDLQLLDEDSDFTYNNDIEHSKARGRSVLNRSPNADTPGDEDYSDDDVDDTKPAATEIETIQPKTLALNDGSNEVDDICDQVRTGQTGILALGATPNRFLLISTNLFVYEMALTAQDPEQNPPFKLLVTGQPVSLRDRWPEAYNWAQSHSGDILYSFVSTQHQFQAEYVIFVYRSNVTVCSVALDLNSGALLSGPCDDSFEEYEATSFGIPLEEGFPAALLTVSRQNGGTTVCLHVGMLFAAEPKSEEDLPVPCDTFDQCRYFYVLPPELSPPESTMCLAPYPSPIVTIFQYRLGKIYMIDWAGQVHQVHIGPDYLKVPPLPLDKFIGCNEADTIKLQSEEKWLWIVIVLLLLLQVGLCALMFFMYGRLNQLPASDQETGEVH